MIRRHLNSLFILGALLLAAGVSAAQEQQPDKRVYLMGNSLTDQMDVSPDGAFATYIRSAGVGLALGKHTCAGIYLDWFWEHPNHGFSNPPFGTWGTALRDYPWDVLSLQPYWKPYNTSLKYAKLLIAEALKKSPDLQVCIYQQWARVLGGNYYRDWRDGYDPDRAAPYCRKFYEDYVRALREAFPQAKPVKLIPVGDVLDLLDQKMRAGEVPGYTSIFQVYIDNQHFGTVGSYISAATHLATIYGVDPRKVPPGPYSKPMRPGQHGVSDELAKIISQTVWEVVSTNPLTGVTSDDPLAVVTPILPSAVVGEPYRAVLQHAFGKSSCTWRVVSGTLPEGLAMDPTGVITGTCAAPQTTGSGIEVADAAGANAKRELKLVVAEDSAPKITTKTLPDVRAGENYAFQLQADGGNPPLIWRAITGVPPGLGLASNGTIDGTAGKPGSYRLKVEVRDGDPEQPESDHADLSLNILPPGPDVLQVAAFDAKTNGDIKVDGKLDEPLWNLDQTVDKLVRGQAFNNRVTWGAIWRGYHLFVAVKVLDSDIETGNENPEKNDSVEFFVDGLNNREKIYNNDDRRIVIDAAGRKQFYGESKFFEVATQRIDGGYTVELHLSAHNLQTGAFQKPWTAMGFDIAVNDVDKGAEPSQAVWKGNADDAAVPDSFGTLLFVPSSRGANL